MTNTKKYGHNFHCRKLAFNRVQDFSNKYTCELKAGGKTYTLGVFDENAHVPHLPYEGKVFLDKHTINFQGNLNIDGKTFLRDVDGFSEIEFTQNNLINFAKAYQLEEGLKNKNLKVAYLALDCPAERMKTIISIFEKYYEKNLQQETSNILSTFKENKQELADFAGYFFAKAEISNDQYIDMQSEDAKSPSEKASYPQIIAMPELEIIPREGIITYEVIFEDKNQLCAPRESTEYAFSWYVMISQELASYGHELLIVPVSTEQTASFSFSVPNEEFRIVCCIKHVQSGKATYIEKKQLVGDFTRAAASQFDAIKKEQPQFQDPVKYKHFLAPEAVLDRQWKQLDFLLLLNDTPECPKNYKKRIEMYQSLLTHLRESTLFLSQLDGYSIRHTTETMELHVDPRIAQEVERIYFLAMYMPDPARTGVTSAIQLQVFLQRISAPNGLERWQVVDWTGPGKHFRGMYPGEPDENREKAIQNAINKWENDNWYLENGKVYYQINTYGAPTNFDTRKNWKEEVHDAFFAAALWSFLLGVAVGAVVALVVAPPVGLYVFSLFGYASMGLAAAGSAVSLYDRSQRQINTNLKEYTLDTLTIGSALLWGTWALIGRITLTRTISLTNLNNKAVQLPAGETYLVIAGNVDELAAELQNALIQIPKELWRIREEIEQFSRLIGMITRARAAVGLQALSADAMIVVLISKDLWNFLLEDKNSSDLRDHEKMESILDRLSAATHSLLVIGGVFLMPMQTKQFLADLTRKSPLPKVQILDNQDYVALGIDKELFQQFNLEGFNDPKFFVTQDHGQPSQKPGDIPPALTEYALKNFTPEELAYFRLWEKSEPSEKNSLFKDLENKIVINYFRVGGSGENSVAPTKYNPSGRMDNCGFTAIAYSRELLDLKFLDADQLYLLTRQILDIQDSEILSHMVVFPLKTNENYASRPGYEVLTEGTRSPSDYTVTNIAEMHGLKFAPSNDALTKWGAAFGLEVKNGSFGVRSLEDAVEARFTQLERQFENGQIEEIPSLDMIEKHIIKFRKSLPGKYIIGSYTTPTTADGHYMNIEIKSNGEIVGFDPQTNKDYSNLVDIKNRMGNIDLILKLID